MRQGCVCALPRPNGKRQGSSWSCCVKSWPSTPLGKSGLGFQTLGGDAGLFGSHAAYLSGLDTLFEGFRSTIQAVDKTLSLLAPFGISPSYLPLGPHPVGDAMGYRVAVAMGLKSTEPGRYADHQQFETIRKLRAGFHNVYMASVPGATSLREVGGDRSKHFLNLCDTHSVWFEHFAAGCLRRMGQEIWQDRAISLNVMHALLHHLEGEWTATTDPGVRLHAASLGAYSVIAFCGSFRGPEVFMTDLYGLRKYLDTPPYLSRTTLCHHTFTRSVEK